MGVETRVCSGDCPWDEVAGLLRSSFETFRGWGLTGGDLLLYRLLDPAVARGFHVVAEADGTAVSHVQVVVRRLLLGGVPVPVCGIANVATRPGWRGRGLASRLLSEALAECRRRGIPLAGLWTGFLSAAHRVYRRLGFRDVAPEKAYGAPIGEAAVPAGGVEVRPLERGDAAAAERLYRELSREWGFATAEREAMEARLFERRFYHTFFYDDPGRVAALAAIRDGALTGYALAYAGGSLARPYGDPAAGYVYELVAADEASLWGLYAAAVEELASRGARGVWLHAPGSRLYARLRGMLWEAGGGGTYMAAILDAGGLAARLAEALSRRLRALGLCAEGRVVLRAGHSLGFRVSGCDVEAAEGGAAVYMGEVDLLRLIHGEAGLAGLVASGRAVPQGVPGGVLRALDAALRGGFYVWPMDHW